MTDNEREAFEFFVGSWMWITVVMGLATAGLAVCVLVIRHELLKRIRRLEGGTRDELLDKISELEKVSPPPDAGA